MAKALTGTGWIYYALLNEDGKTYGDVKKLARLIEITVKDNWDTTKSYAGNIAEFQGTAYSGTDLSFTVHSIEETAEIELFGHKKATEGGVIYSSKDSTPYVAIMAELTEADQSNKEVTDYLTLYKGQLTPPELKGKTKEGKIEYQTKEFSGSFVDTDDGLFKYLVATDSTGFNADTWKTKWGKEVIIPTEDAA